MQPHEGFHKKILFREIYFATRSSHFSMNNMVHIEMQQATTNTVHVIQIGIDSYNTAPMNSNWLPMAVAPSQPPCMIP